MKRIVNNAEKSILLNLCNYIDIKKGKYLRPVNCIPRGSVSGLVVVILPVCS